MGSITGIVGVVTEKVPFVQECINYCKEHLILVGIIAALVAVLFIVFIAILVIASKAKKAKKLRKAAERLAAENAAKEKAAAAAKAKAEAEAKAKAAAEAKAKAEAEEKAKAEAEAKAKEAAKASQKQAVKKEAPVKKAAPQTKKEEADKQGKYAGKWVICRMLTEGSNENEEVYFFELRASNGEKLLSSEEYTSYEGALKGIETHKSNIARNNFRITLSKKGFYIFKLLSGKNTLLCTGENYPSKARCESAIDSTKRFAESAVLDENVQELHVKIPAEDDSVSAPLPDGYNGKWVIDSGEGADGEKVYYFELYANNGEKLLTSEEYTSYVGAVNGISTHKRNIEAGNFRITLTKRGDYIYKLLNGNGQLLCLGEHYRTRRLCQNAVESVKRFALNSPTVTEESAK